LAVALAALLAVSCGSGSTTLLSPSEQRCGLTLSPTSASMGAGGGTGSITVTTSRECQWTASASAAWLQLTSGTTGQGNGTIAYEIAANASTSPRNTSVSVGNSQVAISQQAATCPFSTAPSTFTVGAGGGDVIVSLTSESFCSWTLQSQVPWISITSGGEGSGNGEARLHVDLNPGSERTGAVTFGSATITVKQSAAPSQAQTCPVALSPSASTIGASGGPLSTTLTIPSGCAWTVSSGAPWIRLTSPASGSGGATISFTIDANTGVPRIGTATIAGSAFMVSQQAVAACTFSVSPMSFNNVVAGGTGLDITVTSQAGCGWTASSNQSWVTISPGSSGSGNGTVHLNVAANSGGARSANVTVAGSTVTVQQAAAAPNCSYAINPTSFNASATGGNTSVAVTTTAGCAWTVTGNPSWISVNPASGTGNGNVSVTVQANVAGSRTATLTIAGRSFSVSQAAVVPCVYTIAPGSLNNVAGSGGTSTVTVTTTPGCAWSVDGNPSWIDPNPGSGTGAGSLTLTILPNPGTARSANFTIATQPFSVSQRAVCTYTLNPTSMNISNADQSKSITVNTQSGCTSSASTNVNWIHITSTAPAGGGHVDFDIDRNDAAARTGTVTVTGQSFTQNVSVTQAGR